MLTKIQAIGYAKQTTPEESSFYEILSAYAYSKVRTLLLEREVSNLARQRALTGRTKCARSSRQYTTLAG